MTAWPHMITALFVEHRARLEALVRRRIRDRDAAGDIVQDVFIRVFAAGTRGSDEADRRVLYVAARNAAIDHNRIASGRQSVMAALLPEQIVASQAPEDNALESREAIAALDRALAELPPRSRDVFIGRRVHGETNAQIARRLGISVSAVEKHLLRAMQHCRRAVSDHLDAAARETPKP